MHPGLNPGCADAPVPRQEHNASQQRRRRSVSRSPAPLQAAHCETVGAEAEIPLRPWMQVWPTGFALEEPLLLDAPVWGHGDFVPAFTARGIAAATGAGRRCLRTGRCRRTP
jgi:hypothetical protein